MVRTLGGGGGRGQGSHLDFNGRSAVAPPSTRTTSVAFFSLSLSSSVLLETAARHRRENHQSIDHNVDPKNWSTGLKVCLEKKTRDWGGHKKNISTRKKCPSFSGEGPANEGGYLFNPSEEKAVIEKSCEGGRRRRLEEAKSQLLIDRSVEIRKEGGCPPSPPPSIFFLP